MCWRGIGSWWLTFGEFCCSSRLAPRSPSHSRPGLSVGGALGPSLAPQVRASRGLYKLLKPVADAYSSLSGYRRVGLKYDDILIEETPLVQKVGSSPNKV